MNGLRLEIGPVIRNAEEIRQRVLQTLPNHTGLPILAEGVANAARTAEKVSKRLKRPFGVHRLPVAFLTVALLLFVIWLYLQFFASVVLTLALPDRDARDLHEKLSRQHRLQFRLIPVPGSREAVELVSKGKVDLAFVQGGIPVPPLLPRMTTQHPEMVLWFLRSDTPDASSVRKVLTSVKGEGSHSVAQVFMRAWKIDSQVEYLHDWKALTDEAAYEIAEDIDAVFVVKDPSDDKTIRGVERLSKAGFRLRAPSLGARALPLDYLQPTAVPAGYFQTMPDYPADPVGTYTVHTFLVASRSLNPRMLSTAIGLIEGAPVSMASNRFDATVGETSEILQGVEAFMGILINIVLAFLALLGVEMIAYRKRFHELNSLVSLISIHQSSKDVMGVTDPKIRRDNLTYLSLCSDLLGLISTISGYYTQENSSLLFNNLSEVIHQRCGGLKINIQLKILHAMLREQGLEEPLEKTSDPGPIPVAPIAHQ